MGSFPCTYPQKHLPKGYPQELIPGGSSPRVYPRKLAPMPLSAEAGSERLIHRSLSSGLCPQACHHWRILSCLPQWTYSHPLMPRILPPNACPQKLTGLIPEAYPRGPIPGPYPEGLTPTHLCPAAYPQRLVPRSLSQGLIPRGLSQGAYHQRLIPRGLPP